MKLFFDTETTGKYDFRSTPDAPHQPRLVQLGAILVDGSGDVQAHIDLIIEPDGWVIPAEAVAIHGISTAIACDAGVPLRTALSVFNHLYKHASIVIAHNLLFDESVMLSQFAYARATCRINGTPLRVCTMRAATPYLKLPKSWDDPKDPYKWPTLNEAHEFYCGAPMENAHKAMSDVLGLIRVYNAMVAKGHL